MIQKGFRSSLMNFIRKMKMVWIWTAKMKHHELVQQSGRGKWNYELIMLWLKDDLISYTDINWNNILHLNILGNLGVLVFLK